MATIGKAPSEMTSFMSHMEVTLGVCLYDRQYPLNRVNMKEERSKKNKYFTPGCIIIIITAAATIRRFWVLLMLFYGFIWARKIAH